MATTDTLLADDDADDAFYESIDVDEIANQHEKQQQTRQHRHEKQGSGTSSGGKGGEGNAAAAVLAAATSLRLLLLATSTAAAGGKRGGGGGGKKGKTNLRVGGGYGMTVEEAAAHESALGKVAPLCFGHQEVTKMLTRMIKKKTVS